MGIQVRHGKKWDLHVWRHSVTVVASIKYPLHILQVMWLFKVLSFILLSISATNLNKAQEYLPAWNRILSEHQRRQVVQEIDT